MSTATSLPSPVDFDGVVSRFDDCCTVAGHDTVIAALPREGVDLNKGKWRMTHRLSHNSIIVAH